MAYLLSDTKNFWVRVYVGDGHLGGVGIHPEPGQPVAREPYYEWFFGQSGAGLDNRELTIEADVQQVGAFPTASILAELYETKLDVGPDSDPNTRERLGVEEFSASGPFDQHDKAQLEIVVELRCP